MGAQGWDGKGRDGNWNGNRWEGWEGSVNGKGVGMGRDRRERIGQE